MKKLILLICIISIIIKLGGLFVLGRGNIASDAQKYISIADNLIAGKGFSIDGIKPTNRVGPIYPFFLVILIKLFGHNTIVFKMANIILLSLLPILVYVITLKIYQNKITSLIAAAITAIYPAFIGISLMVLTESLFIFLFMFSLYLLFNSIENNNIKDTYLSGILLGLATLCRPVTIGFSFWSLFVVIILKLKYKKSIKSLFILTVISTIIIIPWIIRNYYVFNRFIPVTDGSKGIYGGYLAVKYGDINYRKSNEYQSFRSESLKDSSDKGEQVAVRRALKELLNNPTEFLYTYIIKFKRLWLEVPGQTKVLKDKTLILWLFLITYYIILIFAISALFINRVKINFYNTFFISTILYFTIIHILTVGTARYRLPLMPLLIILASVTIEKIIIKIKLINF